MNIADIHKKYDAQFRQLMAGLIGEVNEALQADTITAVEVTFDVESVTRRESGTPGISAILLTDAHLNLSVKYGG